MRKYLILPLAALMLALPVASASALTPKAGVYHGTVGGTVATRCQSDEGEGYLRVTGRTIVPVGNGSSCGFSGLVLSKILAPSSFACNQFNANISTASININARDIFLSRSTEPIGPGGAARQVTFRGAFIRDGVIRGTTRIVGDGCDHTDHWVMARTGA